MKQKFIKALIVTVLALSLVVGMVTTSFALPINNVSNSYFYDVNGKAILHDRLWIAGDEDL